MSTREANANRVAALAKGGFTAAEIGQRLGLAQSYVHTLTHDPDGKKVAARRHPDNCDLCDKPIRKNMGRCGACKRGDGMTLGVPDRKRKRVTCGFLGCGVRTRGALMCATHRRLLAPIRAAFEKEEKARSPHGRRKQHFRTRPDPEGEHIDALLDAA